MREQGMQVVEFDEALKAFVERRRKRRVQVHVPIVVKGLDFQGSRFEEATDSVNFSASGTCFFLNRRVKVAATVVLLISLPPDLKTYKITGEVTRVEGDRGKPRYKYGIEFTHGKRKTVNQQG